MTKLKVAVIGAGSIAKYRHLPEYKANPQTEIVAICDINEARAKEMAAHYEIKHVFTDYKELLKEDLDIVSVCLPNYLHAPVSIAASEAGCHVLVEKPMATSSEEAEAMIAAAKQAGKLLMVGHNQRFVPSHQKAKELLASGELGKVHTFRTAFGHGGPEGWSADGKDSWFFRKEEAFIGAMGDLGVHKADLIRHILGEEVVEVGAMVEQTAKENSDVDDNAICILKTESGIIGTLTASWSYKGQEDNSTIIYAEKGSIRLEDDPEYSVIINYLDGTKDKQALGKIQTNEDGGQNNSGVIDHFVTSILNGTEPLITGEEGKKSLEVILGALKSSESKQIIRLR
ncbi:Gfo/Idh/MocA family protein [Bacillus horti]|uniref:Dehydrogenase n=1 Tax=Caldalkalibacillus horti TaxID=77523 RepID=A0ABT9VXA7_9BACI|nr:Gfo/Idh/MocA family oxidoreductase [Bacillus horti]MDQ0165626.1 putative dehydrogenase [Bacillus horti]